MPGDWGNRREITSGGGGFCSLDLSKAKGKHSFFEWEEGTNRIEILPYVISNKLHPLVAKKKRNIGDLDYNLGIAVHRNVGAGKNSYICPNKNYGKPCPICEAADDLKKQSRAKDDNFDKTASALYASVRYFYNVLDNLNRDAGVQILEASGKYFQKPLEAADSASKTDADIQEKCPNAFFPDVKNGLTLKVIGEVDTYNNKEYIKPSGISFAPRREGVEEHIKDVVLFDQCIKVLSYEELEAIFTGEDADDTDEGSAEEETQEAEEAPVVKFKKAQEEKPAVKEVPPSTSECPHGFAFGKDNDEHRECAKCPSKTYVACARAH